MSAPTTEDAPAVDPTPTRRGAVLGMCDAHPVAVSCSIALAFAVGHAVWIWSIRRVGAFDADEAGYLADALRFHSALFDGGPASLWTEIRRSGTAPLVPLLSAGLMVPGSRDPRMAMMVQPILMVVTATAIASSARRFCSPRTTVLGTAAFLTFPATLHAAQSYWYGLGVAAALSIAILALFRSERGTNRWIWVFGAALGAMALSRTMALGFLPAALAAAVVVVGNQRRGLLRLWAATLLAAVLAVPWYGAARGAVFDYLVSYGYGERAGLFGSASLSSRVLDVPLDLVLSAGVILPTLVVAAWIVTSSSAIRHMGARRTLSRVLASRERLALIVLATLGGAALLSTANQGGWFSYPLFVALVPLGAEVLQKSARAWRLAASTTIVVQGSILTMSAWWLVPYGAVVPFPTHYEPAFAEYDERFGPTRRAELDATAAEWREFNADLATTLRSYRDDTGAMFTMSGNMLLLNTNTIALAAQLDDWNTDFRVPETVADPEERSNDLMPTDWNRQGERVERILVIADHSETLFTPDADVGSFLDQARSAGWQVVDEFQLPIEGAVIVLRHERAEPTGSEEGGPGAGDR